MMVLKMKISHEHKLTRLCKRSLYDFYKQYDLMCLLIFSSTCEILFFLIKGENLVMAYTAMQHQHPDSTSWQFPTRVMSSFQALQQLIPGTGGQTFPQPQPNTDFRPRAAPELQSDTLIEFEFSFPIVSRQEHLC